MSVLSAFLSNCANLDLASFIAFSFEAQFMFKIHVCSKPEKEITTSKMSSVHGQEPKYPLILVGLFFADTRYVDLAFGFLKII